MDWPFLPLATVATIDRNTVQAVNIEAGVLYVGLENIVSGGDFIKVRPVSIGELGSSKFRFNRNHILYGKLRPYLAKIARPCFEGVCSTDILPILPGPLLDRNFLSHFLRQREMVDKANGLASGVNLPRLSPDALAAFEIPLPALSEQRRIAAILDQAETLRAQRRAAIALLDSLGQAIFLEMFGEPLINPKAWPLVRLDSLGSLDRGVSKHRPRNAPDLLGGPYPLVQTGDVANCDGDIRSASSSYSEFGLKQSKLWPKGTLCITIAANIARTGVLRIAACFPDSVVGFNATESATVEFVRVWLSFLQKTLEDSAPESAQKNINLATLRNLMVPLPPLALRQLFACRMNAAASLKATHRTALARLDELFASLQHRAFRGEL